MSFDLNEETLSTPILYYVVAKKGWTSQENEELSFKEGTKLAVLHDTEIWWYGKVVNDDFQDSNTSLGFFPSSCVEKINYKKDSYLNKPKQENEENLFLNKIGNNDNNKINSINKSNNNHNNLSGHLDYNFEEPSDDDFTVSISSSTSNEDEIFEHDSKMNESKKFNISNDRRIQNNQNEQFFNLKTLDNRNDNNNNYNSNSNSNDDDDGNNEDNGNNKNDNNVILGQSENSVNISSKNHSSSITLSSTNQSTSRQSSTYSFKNFKINQNEKSFDKSEKVKNSNNNIIATTIVINRSKNNNRNNNKKNKQDQKNNLLQNNRKIYSETKINLPHSDLVKESQMKTCPIVSSRSRTSLTCPSSTTSRSESESESEYQQLHLSNKKTTKLTRNDINSNINNNNNNNKSNIKELKFLIKNNFTWHDQLKNQKKKYFYQVRPLKSKKNKKIIKNKFIINRLFAKNTQDLRNQNENEKIEIQKCYQDFKSLSQLLSVYKPLAVPTLKCSKKNKNLTKSEICEYFLNSIANHPILRNSEYFETFLYDQQTKKEKKKYLKQKKKDLKDMNILNKIETKKLTKNKDMKLDIVYQKSLIDFQNYTKNLELSLTEILDLWGIVHNKLQLIGTSYENLSNSINALANLGLDWNDGNSIIQQGQELERDSEKNPEGNGSIKIQSGIVSLSNTFKQISKKYQDESQESIKIINNRIQKILYDLSNFPDLYDRFSNIKKLEIVQQNIYIKHKLKSEFPKIKEQLEILNHKQYDSNKFLFSILTESEIFKKEMLLNLKDSILAFLKKQIIIHDNITRSFNDVYDIIKNAKFGLGVYFVKK
ncbi:sorting nexin [Anaeramoeba flamelloides]|uniref:Sorting nexin n=1 Tax=Anaeramoeba flamelloides TaxID=1746091 RepID=A0AAV7YC37_9EUKA|nr:sorting nexin [Anaeramoeba flamelloides]